MLIFSMLYDMIRVEEKMIVDAARRKGIDLKLYDSKQVYLDLSKDYKKTFGDVLLQRCVSYYRNLHLTAALEHMGIKVINDFHSALIAGNKLFTTLALLKAGVPTPRTMLSFTSECSLKALQELGYPAVLKPTVGSWGRLIAILKDPETAECIFEDREHMFPLYQVHYLQELVKKPPRDIRSVVIGDRVVAAIYRVSPTGDWKTNTARGAKAVNCPVTSELEALCLKAARSIGNGIYGVDCMETQNGILVHEVNNTIEFRNTVPATGVDIPSLILDYMVGTSK